MGKPASFTPKWTPAQKDAIERAAIERGMSARVIAEHAAAGTLQDGMAPFTISAGYTSQLVRRARHRRAGRLPQSAIAGLPAATAIDRLRDRLLAAAEGEMQIAEGLFEQVRASDKLRLDDQASVRRTDRLRGIARALREAAAIPDPSEDRPMRGRRPGHQGNRNGATTAETEATLAGGIFAAHRGDTGQDPATDLPTENRTAETDSAEPSRSEGPTRETDLAPGSAQRASVEA